MPISRLLWIPTRYCESTWKQSCWVPPFLWLLLSTSCPSPPRVTAARARGSPRSCLAPMCFKLQPGNRLPPFLISQIAAVAPSPCALAIFASPPAASARGRGPWVRREPSVSACGFRQKGRLTSSQLNRASHAPTGHLLQASWTRPHH